MIRNLLDQKCTISYYLEGARNDLGEPSQTLTERDSNIPCRIMPSFRADRESPLLTSRNEPQGTIFRTFDHAYLGANIEIIFGDIITDENGNTYSVAHILKFRDHKEAVLLQIND